MDSLNDWGWSRRSRDEQEAYQAVGERDQQHHGPRRRVVLGRRQQHERRDDLHEDACTPTTRAIAAHGRQQMRVHADAHQKRNDREDHRSPGTQAKRMQTPHAT